MGMQGTVGVVKWCFWNTCEKNRYFTLGVGCVTMSKSSYCRAETAHTYAFTWHEPKQIGIIEIYDIRPERISNGFFHEKRMVSG